MKDITLLIAHADDEAIFLWPFLDRVKRIVCASNDAFNPERTFCKERGQCLADVGKLLGCEIVCHSNNSEFYRAPTRNGALHLICSDLFIALEGAEVVATHNAWGEYFHIDHLLCHGVARTFRARTGCRLLTTDIAVLGAPSWMPVSPWDQGNIVSPRSIDMELYEKIKSIYDSRGCWTWSFPVQKTCTVIEL